MNEIIGICILAIAGILIALNFKAVSPHYSIIIGLAIGLAIFYFSLDKITAVLQAIARIRDYIGNGTEYLGVLVKVLGVTYICEFSSDICKDAGYGLVANQIEILGKFVVMISGISILFAVIEQIRSLV